jgi:hypothetical protein
MEKGKKKLLAFAINLRYLIYANKQLPISIIKSMSSISTVQILTCSIKLFFNNND